MAERAFEADSTNVTHYDEGFETTDSPLSLNESGVQSSPVLSQQQRAAGGTSQMVSGRPSALKSTDQLDEKKTICILLTPIGDAPHTDQLIKRLKVLLDPPRSFGGDVKSLADSFGYTNSEINYLTSKQYGSPTEDLLRDKGNCTFEQLIEKLEDIKRPDVVTKVKDYIRLKCKCDDCIDWTDLC